MSSTKMIRVLWLCLSIIISWLNFGFSSLATGTLVATSGGLVPIEKLKIGNKILSYKPNESNPNKAIIEVAITKIDKHFTDSMFDIYTAKNRLISASPQQLFFTLKSKSNQTDNTLKSDNSLIVDFVQAQYITKEDMFIGVDMLCVPIIYVNKTELYSEKIERDKHKRIRSMERRFTKVDVYAIEVEEPHTFLISDGPYNGKNEEPRFLLTHNGLPALGAALSFTFGSTPASVSFAEATLTGGGIGAKFGPYGLAVGVVTGLGIFGYQYFFGDKKGDGTFYLERSDSNGHNGGNNQKHPNKTPSERVINTITKAEFFRQLKDQYEHWKDGVYQLKDRAIGLLDGKAQYLKWDHLHNDVEVYNRSQKHLGSLDPRTMQLYKGPVNFREMLK